MNNLHAPLMGSTINLVPIMLMGPASASRKRKDKQKHNKQIVRQNEWSSWYKMRGSIKNKYTVKANFNWGTWIQ